MTSRVKSIVVGSKAQLGNWVEERHNLLNDYRRAFNEDPPNAMAVGFMTDSDNSASVVNAYYGDIRIQGP
jgi:menaquinone-dependent protoporphyrinogen IX oxidase